MRGDAREAEHGAGQVMHCPHCLAVMLKRDPHKEPVR